MNQIIKTKTTPKQTLLSLVILGILVVISASVYLAQFNYNPAVQQMAPALADGQRGQTAPSASAQKSLIPSSPSQVPLSPLETFDAATLSDKINGKAELYLSAGFVRLHSQRFKDPTVGDMWMEVFVYDMQTPQNAFSVFSVQRRDDSQSLDVGKYAYQTPNAIFFVHGHFYVEIVASDISETIFQRLPKRSSPIIPSRPKPSLKRSYFPKRV